MNNYTNFNQQYQNFSPNIHSKTQPYSFYNKINQSQSSNKISQNPNLISNQNYGSNQNFYPNQKNQIKWRNINKINLTQLQKSRDINLIQSYLDNLIQGQITEEDIQSIPENVIVKLIQILQTMSDILLNEQSEFENERIKLESENMKIMSEFKQMDKYNLKNKEKIHRLKKEKKRDIGVINTYLNVINKLKSGTYFNIQNYNITDINIDKRQSIESTKLKAKNIVGEFKCEYCPDKNFETEYELTKHLDEVHGIKKSQFPKEQNVQNQVQIIKPEVTIKVPDNLKDLNNNNYDNEYNEELLRKMENMQSNFFKKMEEEKRRELEILENTKKMHENNYNFDINKMENTFRDTLDNFKNMLEQNKNDNQSMNEDNNEEIMKKMKENEKLEEELIKARKNEEEKKNEYEIEMKKLYEISIETTQIKKYEEDNYILNTNKKINNIITISQNDSINYQTKQNKKKRKEFFNSGKIESDHDDTDKENEKAKEQYKNLINTITQQHKYEKQEIPEKKIINDNNSIINIEQTTFNKKEDNTDLKAKKKYDCELDNYYKRYSKRDKKFLKNNDISDYLVDTLPDKFNSDKKLNLKSKEIMEEKIMETAKEIFPKNLNLNIEINVDQIQEENINNLFNLTQNLMNEIDLKKTENIITQKYYESIMDTLGFKKIKKTTKIIGNKLKLDNGSNISIKSSKEKKDKDKENNIDTKDNNNTEIINSINNVNNAKNTLIKEKSKENEIKENNIIDNNNIQKENEMIIQDIIMDKNEKDEEKLKNPQNTDTIPQNQIQNFKPNILDTQHKKENIIIETGNIKNIDNKLQENNKGDVPYNSNMAKESNLNNIGDVPYNSSMAKEPDLNNKGDVPYNSNMVKEPNNKGDVPYNSNMAKEPNNKGDVPYNSNMAIEPKSNDAAYTYNMGNIQINNINNKEDKDKNLDTKYNSDMAKGQININNETQNLNNINNISNQPTQLFQNTPTGNTIINNNNNHLDTKYNSEQAKGTQLSNPYITNVNDNNENKLDVGYNSVLGPTKIIDNNNNNNAPDVPYTSNNNNIQLPGGNPNPQQGFSYQNDIYAQKVNQPPQGLNPKKEIEYSHQNDIYGQNNQEENNNNDIKESKMIEEDKNNNTTVIKESIPIQGDNDKSMEFDKMMSKNK